MRRFHHVGIITDEQQPGEIYVAQTKVHVTNQAHHPYRVEYLRFEPDSPVTGPVRQQPHMAFAVDDLEAEIEGELSATDVATVMIVGLPSEPRARCRRARENHHSCTADYARRRTASTSHPTPAPVRFMPATR